MSMRERTITVVEAQQRLESLAEQFSADCPALVVSRNNQPVLTIMPYQTHQELLEEIKSLRTMLEIMCSQEGTIATKGQKGMSASGRSISWEEFQKEVGWE